jgi:hypothetical protein
MRAQTVYRKCVCFDFDECIVTTKARIHVYRNGAHIKSMNSKEYNFYVKKPNDVLDFSEFTDGEMILSAKKYKVWPVLRNVSNAIREGRSTSTIYILTARSSIVKSYIYEFLKKNGIEIQLNHIITIGDDRGIVNISNEKRKVLIKLSKKYKVLFFDDDPKNIKLASSIPGIKTRLVESLNEKFTEDSDPIEDMGIGIYKKIDFETIKEMFEWLDKIIGVFSEDPDYFPEDILSDGGNNTSYYINRKYYQKILDYIEKYVTIKGIYVDAEKNVLKNFHYFLKAKHPELESWLIKESINEKFTEDSDPINDLGIGMMYQIKQFIDKLNITTQKCNNISISDNQEVFDNCIRYDELKFAKYLLEKYKSDINLIYDNYWLLRHCVWQEKWNAALFLIDNGVNIDKCIDLVEKQYECEHMTRHNLTILKKMIEERKQITETMGGVSSPAATLNNVPGMGNVTPATSTSTGSGDNFGNAIGNKIYTQAKSIKTNKKKKRILKKKSKKVVNEKFIEDSDPIHDMGIGMKRKYDEEVEDFIINLAERLDSVMELYLPEKKRVDLFNKVKYQHYKVKTIMWSDNEDKYAPRHNGVPSLQWKKRHINKLIDNGWEKFFYEDNYDQGEFIFIKLPSKKLDENNVSPYDRLGQSMLKRAKVKSVFKKKKEKGNQNAIEQKKFEHEILTYNEFIQLNESDLQTYKREDFPESQSNTRTIITQKLLDYYADVLNIPKFTEDLNKGTYITWLQDTDLGYNVSFLLNSPRKAFDLISKYSI